MSYDTARYGGAVVSRDRGEGVELRVLGTRVAVDTSSLTSDERAHLHSLWDWCLIDPTAAPPEPGIRLVHERGTNPGPPTQIVVGMDWEALPYRLSGAVTIEALRQRVGTDLLFHAAGLSDGAGRVVVLVAASGTGKTTAARTLGTRLGYVSDESVAIRPDGSVTAYQKPLSLVQGESRVRKVEVSPEAAGLIRAPGDLTFARLVLLVRDPELEGAPVVEELDILDAAVRAAAQTSGLAKLTAPLDWLARALTTGGDPVALRYRDIDTCGDVVADLLATPHPPTARWTHHPAGDAVEPVEGEWMRAMYLDAIESEGRVLVLTQRGVSLLDGVGALAWLAAADGVTWEALLAAALDAFGPHPEAARLVDDALAQLAEQSLLRTA